MSLSHLNCLRAPDWPNGLWTKVKGITPQSGPQKPPLCVFLLLLLPGTLMTPLLPWKPYCGCRISITLGPWVTAGERLPPNLFRWPVVLHEQENICTVFELLHKSASTCYGQGSIQVRQPQVYTFLEVSFMKRNTNYKHKMHRSEFSRMRFFFFKSQ